ncbi:amidohydrolase family protein [Terrimonas sp. NA20]|uniref:Amidohydrolase family protein n=1 Tax=Terrimonas ginsenosidimutans TaxID=2908004 RepID=A0ABS9KNB9_9BACT|nr:amidohydrolase family protein [Terrimonas ginsenosidimutans]MCG2613823.1 amidohydrolase family protein [Terrimonas ginsenosidimutans]
MLKIDAHNHFWKFDPVRDSWITPAMEVIRRDFLPAEFHETLQEHGFDGCVVVQSDQTEAENEFQLRNAAENPFIKAVVGWVDLRDPQLESRLEYYTTFSRLKGFRHVLQGEADRSLMLRPAFKQGIGLLRKYGFTYDILIFPDQLKFAKELVQEFPYQKFVIDHIAKPAVKTKEDGTWHEDIRSIAKHENVYCKISGMVTEADWHHWKKEDFHPYIDTVVDAFGTSRIMYGSDWPVCQVAATYTDMLTIVQEYFLEFSADEQAAFFGGNACTFYNIQ